MIICFGGGCAIGYCAQSKSLLALLLDIVEQSDVPTTIGIEIKHPKGCYLCDYVSKIPSRGKARDAVTKGEDKLTKVQTGKVSAT